jgi:hypothetical protein
MTAFPTCPTIDHVRDGRPMLPRAATMQGLASYIEAACPSSAAVSWHATLHGEPVEAEMVALLSDTDHAATPRLLQATTVERRA